MERATRENLLRQALDLLIDAGPELNLDPDDVEELEDALRAQGWFLRRKVEPRPAPAPINTVPCCGKHVEECICRA